MTQLHSFPNERYAKLARSKVKKVDTGLLYYVFNGRNAWHSTWITRYTPWCMHSDLESAKDTAGYQRTQGSKFYIFELPALVFRSAAGAIAVTEINSDNPLEDYSADAVEQYPQDGREKMNGARDCYIARGAPMLGAARSFGRMSRFWKYSPSLRDHVIVVASDDPNETLAPLKEATLQLWQSWSHGGAYRLGWSSRDDNISSEAVRTLAARFLEGHEH